MATFILEVYFNRSMEALRLSPTSPAIKGAWMGPEPITQPEVQKLVQQAFGSKASIMNGFCDFMASHLMDGEKLMVILDLPYRAKSHAILREFQHPKVQQSLKTFYDLLQKRYPMTGRFVALTRESDKKAFYLPYFGSTLQTLRLKRAYAR